MTLKKPSILDRLQNTHDVLLHYLPLHSALADWGKPLKDHLSLWIIEHPDDYQDAIRKSFDAGCDLASTSTQAASRWRAAVFGLEHRVHELNYKSAVLARNITPADRFLCGFVSSTNPDFLEPVGSLTETEVYDGYKEQIYPLLEGGVDCVMVVGNHLEESAIAVKVAKDLANVPVIAQNVFYQGNAGFRTMMGHDAGTATARIVEAGADIVGASCGLMKTGPMVSGHTGYFEAATGLVREMRESCNSLLSIQPNAGMAQLVDGTTEYPGTPEEMAREVTAWIDAGARIVGGCCGAGLNHYRAIAHLVRPKT